MRKLNVPKFWGKGVYIWTARHIFKGDIPKIVEALVAANVNVVAIKAHDAGVVWDVLPLVQAVKAAGIQVIIWGYVYLKWAPLVEADAAIRAINYFEPLAYLIDAEGHAKLQYAGAALFAGRLRRGAPDLPIGLNSYYRPGYHPTLPWKALREISDFDCPQVYWRGTNPVGKLRMSIAEYAAMKPRLPFAAAAGDMYFEGGLKPTPGQVIQFLDECEKTPEIRAVFMWSMDQMKVVPELWKAFSSYKWGLGVTDWKPDELDPSTPAPLWVGVVSGCRYLFTHASPDFLVSTRSGSLKRGERVEVWKEVDGLAKVSRDEERYVSIRYLKKV